MDEDNQIVQNDNHSSTSEQTFITQESLNILDQIQFEQLHTGTLLYREIHMALAHLYWLSADKESEDDEEKDLIQVIQKL